MKFLPSQFRKMALAAVEKNLGAARSRRRARLFRLRQPPHAAAGGPQRPINRLEPRLHSVHGTLDLLRMGGHGGETLSTRPTRSKRTPWLIATESRWRNATGAAREASRMGGVAGGPEQPEQRPLTSRTMARRCARGRAPACPTIAGHNNVLHFFTGAPAATDDLSVQLGGIPADSGPWEGRLHGLRRAIAQ